MSIIDDFKRQKSEHDEMVEMVEKSKLSTNSALMHHAGVKDIYHTVSFSFNIQGTSGNVYKTSERLAEYIGIVSKEIMYSIFDRAISLSQQQLKNMSDDVLLEIEDIKNYFKVEEDVKK